MTFIELLRESSLKYSRDTALIFNDKKWSYAQVYEETIRTSEKLKELGVKAGEMAALLSKNSPYFVFTVFALSRLNSVCVPLNFYLTSEEIAFILKDSGAKIILAQKSFEDKVLQVQKKLNIKAFWIEDLLDMKAGKEAGQTAGESDNTAMILYTSGTSGKSKGALLSHENIISDARSSIQALGLTCKDRYLCLLPLFHIFSWTALVIFLILGSPIVIIESIRPPKPWIKLLFKHRITVFAGVPQVFSLLAEQAKGLKKWILRFLLHSLRFCVSGAAPLSEKTEILFQENLGVALLQGYGLTETSPVMTVNTLAFRKPGTVGKPIPWVLVKIVDENGNDLDMGKEGEIWVKGPNVCKSYHDRPEENRNSFSSDGWFKTGDAGKLDSDGFLTICDRIKDMIIVKGLKVFSTQVEEVLLSHPAVLEAAVVGIPDSEGSETVKAFVVLKEGQSPDKKELYQLCREKLAPYKRPRDIEFRKELPKNALQKVLKRELRKQALRKGET